MHYSPHPLDAHSPKPRRAHADAVTRNVKKFVNNYYYESAAGTMMTNKLFSSPLRCHRSKNLRHI